MSWKNKPVKAPASYPALQGKLVRASRFVDGTIRTFVAPGQTEYAIQNYENPTAWRPQGSLLKMPQVVWLSCHVPYASWDDVTLPPHEHSISRDPLEPDESWDPWWNIWWNGGDGYDRSTLGLDALYVGGLFPGTVEQCWLIYNTASDNPVSQLGNDYIRLDGVSTYCTPDDRPLYDVRSELNTVFQSVKSSIESIRPGKTWVHINHWWFTQLPTYNLCFHLFAPPTDTPYVGTDFLHMYFGMVGYQGPSWFNEVVGPEYMVGREWRMTPFMNPGPTDGMVPIIKSLAYDSSLDRVQAAQDRFAGFRVMLFGHEASIIGWQFLGDDGYGSTPFPQAATAHTTFLQSEGAALADYGYSYEGMGTGISAATIKNKIAAHFGFNPSTGADL